MDSIRSMSSRAQKYWVSRGTYANLCFARKPVQITHRAVPPGLCQVERLVCINSTAILGFDDRAQGRAAVHIAERLYSIQLLFRHLIHFRAPYTHDVLVVLGIVARGRRLELGNIRRSRQLAQSCVEAKVIGKVATHVDNTFAFTLLNRFEAFLQDGLFVCQGEKPLALGLYCVDRLTGRITAHIALEWCYPVQFIPCRVAPRQVETILHIVLHFDARRAFVPKQLQRVCLGHCLVLKDNVVGCRL